MWFLFDLQVVYNSLLNAYANCQLPAKAREVFEKIENEGLQRDVVRTLIAIIITGYFFFITFILVYNFPA